MKQDRLIRFDGIVTEALEGGKYRVEFPNGHQIVAYTQMDTAEDAIQPDTGDHITVEISPTDLNSGRLIFRRQAAHV